ncbi:MAG: ScyD/ScyE family protein [Chloroflexota bacterium]
MSTKPIIQRFPNGCKVTATQTAINCSLRLAVLFIILTLTACQLVVPAFPSPVSSPHSLIADLQPKIVAQNLLGPVGLALLPDGSLLIAEEGNGSRDTSAGITLVTPNGQSGRLISGLFSTRDAGDLAGVPLVSVSPDGNIIYIANFGQDHLWTLPVATFTTAQGNALIPDRPFQPEDLGQAMPPLNNVRLTNPFDMTYDDGGNPIISDASQNGVATTNPDGTTRFFHRFDRIPNPVRATQPVEAVPTGITKVLDEYFITLFGGCPYPAESGQLVAIDTHRNQRTILGGLNLPIDIAQDSNGTLWLLEFAKFTPNASCFDGSGYQPTTGRLSVVTPGNETSYERQTIIDNLNYPGAVLPAPDGSLYISEVLSGRVIRIMVDDINLDMGEAALHTLPATQPLNQTIPKPVPEKLTDQNQSQTSNTPKTSTHEQVVTNGHQFLNVAHASGLSFNQGAFHNALSMDPVAAMGAGLCWIDYDKDGWLDLYLVNSHSLDEVDFWKANDGLPTNMLFRNQRGQFQDVSGLTNSALSLRGNGCVAADFNRDGWTDLYITAHGPNALLWNNGDGTFTEGASDAGVTATEGGTQPEWNSAISVGDLNGDGWPDLFVAGYIDLSRTIPKPTGHFPQDYYGIPDRLYLNQGVTPGADTQSNRVTFREITADAGLLRAERGLGSLFTDLDQDGDLDLYIANDGHPNRLYANEPVDEDPLGLGFRFIDLTETADIGDSGSGMGVTNGDYDGDGALDLFVTNWDTELNALYRNLQTDPQQNASGLLTFQYSTYRIGITGLGNNLTGWGTHLMDVDHDRDLDIMTVNGHVPITNVAKDAQLVRYYRNRTQSLNNTSSRPGHFLDWTKQAGLDQIGPLMARGSAAADYDNDGDLDIAINTIGGLPVLLQNQATQLGRPNQGNWLMVDPGRFTPGLRVTLTLSDDSQLIRESLSGSSYLASEDPRLHFGLGSVEIVLRMEIRWPDGTVEEQVDVKVNQLVKLQAQ